MTILIRVGQNYLAAHIYHAVRASYTRQELVEKDLAGHLLSDIPSLAGTADLVISGGSHNLNIYTASRLHEYGVWKNYRSEQSREQWAITVDWRLQRLSGPIQHTHTSQPKKAESAFRTYFRAEIAHARKVTQFTVTFFMRRARRVELALFGSVG